MTDKEIALELIKQIHDKDYILKYKECTVEAQSEEITKAYLKILDMLKNR